MGRTVDIHANDHIKAEIVALFNKDLSIKDICAKVGISREVLLHWRKRDQMFAHHIIQAQERSKCRTD